MTGHDGWKALPPHLWLVGRALQLAGRLGALPGAEAVAAQSLAERQRGKPAWWACRPAPAGVSWSDGPAPTRNGSVTVRTYRRDDAPSAAEPVVVYLHGGGWVMGGLDGVDPFCARTALDARVTVVSVDYRLAPEHPFPAALEDVVDVLAWLRRDGAALGLDPSRTAIAGDSAGGNLAAAACLLDRDEERYPIRAQALLYPGLDATVSSAYAHGFRGPGLTREDCLALVELYAPGVDRHDPRLSPLLAPDLSGLPPALVLTGGADLLADDGARYVARLQEAGVDAALLHSARAPHAFLGFDRLLPESARAAADCVAFLASHLTTRETAA